MTKGIRKINLFLSAVRSDEASEQRMYPQMRLLHKSYQVVCTCQAIFARQLKLTVKGFKFITNSIHRNILTQFVPIVKGVTCNLLHVRLVCFDLAKSIPAILLDEHRIDRTSIKTSFMQNGDNRFVILSAVCMTSNEKSTASRFERSTATELFSLEASTPTAYLPNLKLQQHLAISHCRFNLFGDASVKQNSTCASRTLLTG